MNDLKFAFRQLLKNPGFTAVAVLTLALGIGANTAIFGALYQVVLKPLPFPESGRLVRLKTQSRNSGRSSDDLTYREFQTLQASGGAFTNAGAFAEEIRNLSGAGVPLRAWGARVSPQFFSAFKVAPMIGRTFARDEFVAGANQVVILNHVLWQDRFGGRADIVGKQITMDGRPVTVCGVMPPMFRFPHRLTTYWTPLVLTTDEVNEPDERFLGVVGRLATGVTPPQMAGRLQSLSQGLPENLGASPDDTVTLVGSSLLSERLGNSRRVLWILFAAVSCATLIGAANLINLFLARVSLRGKELAVRIALGASRRRILRQWATESCLLSLLAGSIGVLLAAWCINLLRTYAPYGLPRADEITLAPAVVAFGFALALLVGTGTSILPLLQFFVRNHDGNAVLKSREGIGLEGRGRRSGLVVMQSAVATALLIGAALLWTSFQRVIKIDPGFSSDQLLTARIVLSEAKYEEGDARRNFYRHLTERVANLPEVADVGLVNSLPLSEIDFQRPLAIENDDRSTSPAGDALVRGNYISVSVNYFQLMHIPLLAGRSFEPADETGAPVVVVSESLAHRYFPGGDSVGRRIKIGPGKWLPWMTIMGVVADVRNAGRDTPSEPTFYVPCLQSELPAYAMQGMFLVVKTRAAAESVVSRLRGVLNVLDPDLALANIDTMNARLRESVATRRFYSTLMGLFAIMAVVLAMTGVFGVLSCRVTDRRREIGVRMALGFSRGRLFQLVLKQGLQPVVAGVVLGWVLALLFRGIFANLLFGVSPNDPRTFLMVGLAFTIIATLACLIPARRAANADPMEALRTE